MPKKVTNLSQPASHLSTSDLMQMLTAERDLTVAKLELERDLLRSENMALQQALQADRQNKRVAEGKAKQDQAVARHRQLVEAFAVRYSIDWASQGFVPDTGEIVPKER